ncbi:MAG: hypothetical protein B6241_05175 [Spirochaetaceae bacterium 4572_59]|nr:MAG: hypothetical protein B6241_05175 [Spirochaetaceae bacterium 4572_59]
MIVDAKKAALILPLFFLLGIGYTMITGYWRTDSSKQPSRYSEGELAGEYNPADIRGSYSLADLEASFVIPVETLAKAFGVEDHNDLSAIKVKEFEESIGDIDGKEVGTDSMRLFVALYLNRPYTPEEGTALPQPAYNILKKEGAAPAAQLALFENRLVPLDTFILNEVDIHEDEEESGLLEIKGKTTFGELLESGISEDQLVDVLGGLPMGATALSVRDYCKEQGLEFSAVKAKLLEYLD